MSALAYLKQFEPLIQLLTLIFLVVYVFRHASHSEGKRHAGQRALPAVPRARTEAPGTHAPNTGLHRRPSASNGSCQPAHSSEHRHRPSRSNHMALRWAHAANGVLGAISPGWAALLTRAGPKHGHHRPARFRGTVQQHCGPTLSLVAATRIRSTRGANRGAGCRGLTPRCSGLGRCPGIVDTLT